MKRSTLDDVSRELNLSVPAVALALDLTGARPDSPAWLAFKLRLLHGAGIGAMAAGIIFFVAANWQDYGLTGRFAILQMALLVCVGLALWRPPPGALGQATLVLAVLVTGALLALFGQSYQTGADLHELFFTWAALALPFALAGRSGAVWATWWIVLNAGLALYCGLQGPNPSTWMWLDRLGAGKSQLMMGACLANLGGAALFAYLGERASPTTRRGGCRGCLRRSASSSAPSPASSSSSTTPGSSRGAPRAGSRSRPHSSSEP